MELLVSLLMLLLVWNELVFASLVVEGTADEVDKVLDSPTETVEDPMEVFSELVAVLSTVPEEIDEPLV